MQLRGAGPLRACNRHDGFVSCVQGAMHTADLACHYFTKRVVITRSSLFGVSGVYCFWSTEPLLIAFDVTLWLRPVCSCQIFLWYFCATKTHWEIADIVKRIRDWLSGLTISGINRDWYDNNSFLSNNKRLQYFPYIFKINFGKFKLQY